MPKVLPGYKEEARARIVEVAQRLFAARGYRRTTMDDVAAALGVSKGALYLYCRSKVDLLREIQARNRQLSVRWMDQALAREHDPAAGFADAFDDVFLRSIDREQIALYLEILGEASHDPEIRATLREDHREDLRNMTRFLGELRRRGQIGPRPALDALAFELIALFEGAVLDLSIGCEPAQVHRTLRAALDHVLAPPGRRPRRARTREN